MLSLNKKLLVIASIFLILLVTVVLVVKGARNMSGAVVRAGSASEAATVKETKETAQKPVEIASDEADIKSAEEAISRNVSPAKTEDAYWKLASIYERRQDLLKARDTYRNIIEKFPSSSNIAKAQEAMENNNVKLLLSPISTSDSFAYEVQKGDSLVKIARKFNTTVELISKANGLKSGILRSGRKLKVTKLKFSIAVDKSQNILTLKADGNVFKTYRVATGKNSSTPVGTFKIITKIIDPPWYPPQGKVIPSGDPKNVLGTRWLGISKPSYGIHGTIDPASIGKAVTEGCVRMKNAEVEELYSIVPEGTEVVIVD